MKSPIVVCLLWALMPATIHGQGTFIYDQESSSDETYFVSGTPIQFYGFVGQSFTPGLSSVGFVRVKVKDLAPGNSLGATLVLNLRSNAINGPIIGTATPLIFGNGFSGSVNFLFPTAVPVTPNLTYFFEASVQSGDTWGITVRSDSLGDVNYAGGSFFGGIGEFPGNDLWFREGIIVPEPSSAVLLFGGTCVTVWRARRKRRS